LAIEDQIGPKTTLTLQWSIFICANRATDGKPVTSFGADIFGNIAMQAKAELDKKANKLATSASAMGLKAQAGHMLPIGGGAKPRQFINKITWPWDLATVAGEMARAVELVVETEM
jgi:hypothetical protein